MVASTLEEEVTYRNGKYEEGRLSKRKKVSCIQTFYARLVSNPFCSCRAYPSGRCFNHVPPPPLNYQTAPMCAKPPIGVVWD